MKKTEGVGSDGDDPAAAEPPLPEIDYEVTIQKEREEHEHENEDDQENEESSAAQGGAQVGGEQSPDQLNENARVLSKSGSKSSNINLQNYI